MMKAICIEPVAGKPELFLREVPVPRINPTELLVRIKSAGVNFADLYRATSHFGSTDEPAAAAVAGLEMAGEVVEVGRAVSGIAVGDRVMAMAQGSYAEYCRVDHRLVVRVPDSMAWEEAAGTLGVFVTAHNAVVTNGELVQGESVFIQAASSSVGVAAIQVAKLFGAGTIIGTSRSAAKLERLKEFGLQHGIDTSKQEFVDAVLQATAGRGADVIIENIGGDTLPGDVRCAAVKCRIINVGRLGKWIGEIDLNEHSRKQIKLIGVTFRTRTIEEHAEVTRRAAEALLPALEKGSLRSVVDRVFPLAEAAAAQDYMTSSGHFGKVVLNVS